MSPLPSRSGSLVPKTSPTSPPATATTRNHLSPAPCRFAAILRRPGSEPAPPLFPGGPPLRACASTTPPGDSPPLTPELRRFLLASGRIHCPLRLRVLYSLPLTPARQGGPRRFTPPRLARGSPARLAAPRNPTEGAHANLVRPLRRGRRPPTHFFLGVHSLLATRRLPRGRPGVELPCPLFDPPLPRVWPSTWGYLAPPPAGRRVPREASPLSFSQPPSVPGPLQPGSASTTAFSLEIRETFPPAS